MKQKLTALLLALCLLGGSAACAKHTDAPETAAIPEQASFAENAVTARTIDKLGNAENTVQMLVLLKDGWIMDGAFGMLYNIAPGKIEGMEYEAVSDDVFRWKPEGDAAQTDMENPNTEMRIIYSDPAGRFIAYSPNVEHPDMANIIMNPDAFQEVIDTESLVIDSAYKYFYKIKDPDFASFSKGLSTFAGVDDLAEKDK